MAYVTYVSGKRPYTGAFWSRAAQTDGFQLRPMRQWAVLDTCGVNELPNGPIEKFADLLTGEAMDRYRWNIVNPPMIARSNEGNACEDLSSLIRLFPDIKLVIVAMKEFGDHFYEEIKYKAIELKVANQMCLGRDIVSVPDRMVGSFTDQICGKVVMSQQQVFIGQTDLPQRYVPPVRSGIASFPQRYVPPMVRTQTSSMGRPTYIPPSLRTGNVAPSNPEVFNLNQMSEGLATASGGEPKFDPWGSDSDDSD